MARNTKPLTAFVTRDQADTQASERERIAEMTAAAFTPIHVHLHCSAPGCENLPSNHDEVWRWIYGASPIVAMRRILTRIERAPAVVIVTDWYRGWIDILGSHPLVDDCEFIPLATICEGLTFEQAHEAHQSLIEAGWKPPTRKAD